MRDILFLLSVTTQKYIFNGTRCIFFIFENNKNIIFVSVPSVNIFIENNSEILILEKCIGCANKNINVCMETEEREGIKEYRKREDEETTKLRNCPSRTSV